LNYAINSIPIPVTDGGQVLMNLLENIFPDFKISSLKYRKLGYLIILLILIVPMLIVFIQNIKTTWFIFVIIGFIAYRFIKVG
jgi:membrane-associated protease RseP (regulator of RpoE activity)